MMKSMVLLLLGAMLAMSLVSAQLPTLPLPNPDIPSDLDPPLAHGRVDVHGWLWLPWIRANNTPDSEPIQGWFYHHTPEFYHDSPHDFEIMVAGFLAVPQLPANLPFPPAAPLVGTEYVFTPPAFSLDQLIIGNLTKFEGPFTNGSFDTPQRYVMTQADFTIAQVTTVHYLSSTQVDNFPYLPYLSYPRQPLLLPTAPSAVRLGQLDENDGLLHAYWLHLLEASPDFDQIIHITLDLNSCVWATGDSPSDVLTAGATFVAEPVPNNVLTRLMPSNSSLPVVLMTDRTRDASVHTKCKIQVLEEIHCVTVPDSFANCPPPQSF